MLSDGEGNHARREALSFDPAVQEKAGRLVLAGGLAPLGRREAAHGRRDLGERATEAGLKGPVVTGNDALHLSVAGENAGKSVRPSKRWMESSTSAIPGKRTAR